jgi:hypothetical protein
VVLGVEGGLKSGVWSSGIAAPTEIGGQSLGDEGSLQPLTEFLL